MIKNTYTLVRQPRTAEVLASDCSSYWLKSAINELSSRDIVDAIQDVEILHAILALRLSNLEAQTDWEHWGECMLESAMDCKGEY